MFVFHEKIDAPNVLIHNLDESGKMLSVFSSLYWAGCNLQAEICFSHENFTLSKFKLQKSGRHSNNLTSKGIFCLLDQKILVTLSEMDIFEVLYYS